MSILAKLPTDPLYHAFFLRAISHASSLGADFGECIAAAQDAGSAPSPHGWAKAWTKQAERLDKHAASLLAAEIPQRQSARDAYLRASNYHRTAFVPLFGHPLDKETVMPAYRAMRDSFTNAAKLFEPPLSPLQIPFQTGSLRGYLCNPPTGVPSNDRLLVLISGYDAPMEEMYFWSAHQALQRGYSVVFFDGPGQGGTLLEDGATMSHTYDKVLEAVLDEVKRHRTWKHTIVQAMSFGGMLCLNAVASKNVQDRVDALIADPPILSLLTSFRSKTPFPASVAQQLPEGPAWAVTVLDYFMNWTKNSKSALGWVTRRGMLVHGTQTPLDYIRSIPEFDNTDIVDQITIPVLITKAGGDDLAFQSDDVFNKLTACKNKKMIAFTEEQGAAEHCEMGARSFYNETVMAWLDELCGTTTDKD